MKNVQTCFSCGLSDPKVECSGIWHCPNALCRGCGSACFRETLTSYEEENSENHSSIHTVCEKEYLKNGVQYNKEHGIDRKDFFKGRDISKKRCFPFIRRKLRNWISKLYGFLED